MQYKKIFLVAMLGILVFAGCRKDATQDGGGPKSNWGINGQNFTEGTNPTSFSSGNLSASDDARHGTISIEFGSRPGGGTFSTTDLSDTSVLGSGSNRCSIDVSTASNNYKSSGSSSGGSVFVSVGSDGKLTASFTGIEMEEISAPSTKVSLSGTLIEK
jgi:hypothetical protein